MRAAMFLCFKVLFISFSELIPFILIFLQKYQTKLYSAAMTGSARAIDKYLELREIVEEQVKGFTEPLSEKLLPDLHPAEQHVFTLVLDLNETLLYTDWKRERGWRTFKRPGVDAFLEHLGKFYEIVVYSDQMEMVKSQLVFLFSPFLLVIS
jgi:import inner membrane translocase subunit TIM50